MAIRYVVNGVCPVTINPQGVTENTPPVTVIVPNVTKNEKRGRGRPKTGVALSDAERMRKYRGRRRADGLR
jgi:U3 small nucleolar ribonucleoprotein component